MKSKSKILGDFQKTLTLIVMASRIWANIRSEISEILEDEIDDLDEREADALLEICEILEKLYKKIWRYYMENKRSIP